MTANHRPLEEGDIELIERVRATPCLYDTKDPDFRLVYKKEHQWQSVAEGLIMSHWEARKRWTVLRDRYARELKQLLLHPDSMEYGKSEFFHRMDFLRTFIKKRSVRRKCNSSNSQNSDDMMIKKRENEDNEINKAIPIKIFKVDGNVSTFDAYGSQEEQQSQLTQQQTDHSRKSFIFEDSQDSSTGRFSYIEQEANDTVGHEHDVDTNHVEGHCETEQEYHDYVEDTSAAYEAVEEDQESDSHYHSISANTVGSSYIRDKFSQLPQLQQRPSNNSFCSPASTTSEPNDSEEYFSKTIALYLKQLSRRHKIKAKVEMMQILEKYIELEEMKDSCNIK